MHIAKFGYSYFLETIQNIYLIAAIAMFFLRIPFGYILMKKEYEETELKDGRQLIIFLFYWWTDVKLENKGFAKILNTMLILPILMGLLLGLMQIQ